MGIKFALQLLAFSTGSALAGALALADPWILPLKKPAAVCDDDSPSFSREQEMICAYRSFTSDNAAPGNAYMNMSGVKDDQGLAHTKLGFRVDVASCHEEGKHEGGLVYPTTDEKAAALALSRALELVRTDLLACLKDMNPEAGAALELTLQKYKPVIYCAGQKAVRERIEANACRKGACGPKDLDFPGANAVALPPPVALLALITADPIVNTAIRKVNDLKIAASKVNAGKTRLDRMKARMTNYANYQPEPSLAPLLFHEGMHVANFPIGSKGHNHDDPTDVVYSCTQLCVGPREKVTEASCLGCMGANGHQLTVEDRLICNQLFGAN